MSTFFDVIINKGKNSFYIVEDSSKPGANNSELETLKKIKHVVENNLIYYSCDKSDYSNKSRYELFNSLKEKSLEIRNGYYNKKNFLWKLINDFFPEFFSEKKEIDAICTKIDTCELKTTLQDLQNMSAKELFTIPTKEWFTILSNEKLYSEEFRELRKMFGLKIVGQRPDLKGNGEVTENVDDTIKQKGNEALILSVRNGDKGILELLLQHGADPNFPASNGSAPLHFAAQAGHTEIVELLLNKGAQVNQQSTNGSSALVFACRGYHVEGKYHKPNNAEVVKLLLERGADPNIATGNGSVPLHWAAQAGSADIVELLLKKDARVNQQSTRGLSALAFACYGHYVEGKYHKPDAEVVKLLLGKGADPNLSANDGVLPLHWAAQAGSADIVELLLKKGADPNIPTGNGLTPLKIASNSLEIVSEDINKNDLTLPETLQKNDELLELSEIILLIEEHIIALLETSVTSAGGLVTGSIELIQVV